jgi:hypothetical protein
MSNYFYKNNNLNQIYENNGTVSSTGAFIGIPQSTGNFNTYSGMNPNPIGYLINGTDIANSLTAKSTIYTSTTSTPISIPTGCKSIRAISVGGGGGGGGRGGTAKMTIALVSDASSQGADGGSGGNGNYAYIYPSLSINSNSQITVNIGNNGTGGESGLPKFSTTTAGIVDSIKGEAGKSGSNGNSSYININGIQYALANGGNGGSGGEGGSVKANSDSKYSRDPGAPNPASMGIGGLNINNNFPSITEYGIGGAGSSPEYTYGRSGGRGAVQIIWLYD